MVRCYVSKQLGEGLKEFLLQRGPGVVRASVQAERERLQAVRDGSAAAASKKQVEAGSGWLQVLKGAAQDLLVPEVPLEYLKKWDAGKHTVEAPGHRTKTHEVTDDFREAFIADIKAHGHVAGKWLLQARMNDFVGTIAALQAAQDSGEMESIGFEVAAASVDAPASSADASDDPGAPVNARRMIAIYTSDFSEEAKNEAVVAKALSILKDRGDDVTFVRFKPDAATQLEHLWADAHGMNVSLRTWVGKTQVTRQGRERPGRAAGETASLKEWTTEPGGPRGKDVVGLKRWDMTAAVPAAAAAAAAAAGRAARSAKLDATTMAFLRKISTRRDEAIVLSDAPCKDVSKGKKADAVKEEGTATEADTATDATTQATSDTAAAGAAAVKASAA